MPRDKVVREPVVRKLILFPEYLWEAIQDYRFANRIPSQTKTLQRLCEIALEAEANKNKNLSEDITILPR